MSQTAGVVLAAGSGSRLRPITDSGPKPLTPVLGRTLLDRAIEALIRAGTHRIFVNTHSQAERVTDHLKKHWPEVVVRRENALSGPAGAMRCFGAELAEYDDILVVSGDALFDGPLTEVLAAHKSRGASLTFATRIVTDARRFGVLEVGPDGRLLRAREKPNVPASEEHLVSAGIYVLKSEVVSLLPAEGVLDFVPHLFPALRERGALVSTCPLRGYWFDIGTPGALHSAVAHLQSLAESPIYVDPGAIVAPTARLEGWVSVENGAVIGDHVWLENSIALKGAELSANSFLIGGVFGSFGLRSAKEA